MLPARNARRRAALVPCCALIFLCTYPAVHLFFFALIPYPVVLTLLCSYFIFAYPALPLFKFFLRFILLHNYSY